MRSVVIFAALALSAAVLVPRYAMQANAPRPAPKMLAARQPHAEPAAASRSVIVPPDAQGHFHVRARVNGRTLSFMVDTGASLIALTAEDAATLGIHPAGHEFSALVQTANGTVGAAPIELDLVEIDDIALHDVGAIVLPEGALGDNLLGLSFLSRLRRFEYAEGKLVLEQ